MTPAWNASHSRSLVGPGMLLGFWAEEPAAEVLDSSSVSLSFLKAVSKVVFSALSGYLMRSHH